MEEACRGVPLERTVGELKLQKSRWLRPHCLKPHRRGFQACLVSFMCSMELHGHSVLVLGHAQRSKGKRLWLVAWIGQTKIKETRQLGHKLQDHKTGASMHEFSFESGDQREAQAGVILKGYSLGTLPGGGASNRGSYCWRYRAWGRRPRAATGRSITRMVGAVVGDAWWLGDSTKNPHLCPERVSFEHPIKSTWHNARSWQCRWHRTVSISPNPLPSGEPLWKGQKLQLCNGRARGGGEWRVTNTADHGLYPTVGFRHDPILFSLVWELGVWLLHWTGRFIAGKILLLSHKSVGRTSRPTRDFTQGRGKNQALEEGMKGHGEKASRCSMRPPTASTPHWVPLARKGNHIVSTIISPSRPTDNVWVQGTGTWAPLREFPPRLLLKIGKSVSWHLEHETNKDQSPQSVTSVLKCCLTLLNNISIATCWICLIAGKIWTS